LGRHCWISTQLRQAKAEVRISHYYGRVASGRIEEKVRQLSGRIWGVKIHFGRIEEKWM
jgi:hypothetical protein